MIAQVVYTNSNCNDVWPMFITENVKYTDIPLFVISDYQIDVDGENISGCYVYDNNDPYYMVWIKALMEFAVDHFIYLQEDFILNDWVDEATIFSYTDYLRENRSYSFIRLLKASSFGGERVYADLHEVESNNKNVFAMQPTIWKTHDYIDLMDAVQEPKWLETKNYRKWMNTLGMKGLFHHSPGEKMRGKYHYESRVFPCITSAIIKGKWNISEYPELKDLCEKYDIDPSIRGVR